MSLIELPGDMHTINRPNARTWLDPDQIDSAVHDHNTFWIRTKAGVILQWFDKEAETAFAAIHPHIKARIAP